MAELARPFLPTRHFEQAKQFYLALGFELRLDGDVAIFGIGASSFILQRPFTDPRGVLWHVAERRPGVAHDR